MVACVILNQTKNGANKYDNCYIHTSFGEDRQKQRKRTIRIKAA